MIKNEDIIIENFFGINNNHQEEIYNMLIDTSKEANEEMLTRSLENTFKDYIKKINKLYEINSKGLLLNSFYTEKILKDNKTFIKEFISNTNYEKLDDYIASFFYNCQTYDLNIINKVNAIFNVKKVNDNIAIEFVNEYKNKLLNNRLSFIRKLIMNNYILTYLSPNYIPGLNNMDNEFDSLIIHLFGDTIYKDYKKLDTIRKIDFIFQFKKEILESYNQQINNYSNKNKILKRNNI